jgi:DNA modification methylase
MREIRPEKFLDGRVTQYCGDVLAVLAQLPDNHFDCVVTSPPYWGLRDYGTARWEGGDPACAHTGHERWYTENSAASAKGSSEAFSKPGPDNAARLKKARWRERGICTKCGALHCDDQLGLERSLGEHLEVMVKVFGEVRRVLKPTGTLWLNYGDCYAASPNGRSAADTKAAGNDDRTFRDKPFSTVGPIFDREGGQVPDNKNPKARAGKSGNKGNIGADFQGRIRAGGYLKPKDLVMVPNRIAIALQDDGWWVRSEIIWAKPNPMPESIKDRPGSSHEKIWLLTKRANYFYDADSIAEPLAGSSIAHLGQDVDGQEGSDRANGGAKTNGKMKAVQREPRGKALTSPRHDGNSWNENNGRGFIPTSNTRNSRNIWTIGTEPFSEAHFAVFPSALAERCIKAGSPVGGLVLDPFGGAGTTGLAAATLGRSATLIELNTDYCKLARARIEAAFMGKDEGSRHMVERLGKTADAGPLFGGQP